MMKINIKYAALSLLAVAGITMASCSDDESYDVYGNPQNLVYFKANADNTFTGTVAHTPVGDFGGVDAKFPVRILRPASCDTKVTAMVDASLVDVYNAEHNTEYKAMPESAVNLGGMTVTIKKGAVVADDSIKYPSRKTLLPHSPRRLTCFLSACRRFRAMASAARSVALAIS